MTYFHTSLWCLSWFHLFEAPKGSVRIKNICHPLPPPPSPLSPISLRRQGLRLRFVELLTYAISISLTIEIHINKTILTTSELLTNSTINNAFLQVFIKPGWHFQWVSEFPSTWISFNSESYQNYVDKIINCKYHFNQR